MHKYQAMIGSVLGRRYTLMSIIGVGGMAVVFSAFDKETGNTVAVKMLREDSEDVIQYPEFKSQFINEAKLLSKLSHSGVVKYYGSSLEKSPLYFVMEYVEGVTLKDYISRRKILPQSEVLDIGIQVLSALSHIHSKGIVHCDIKPHNVILMTNGRIKLTDFGIARAPGVIPDLPPDRAVGTVYYVSPEQAEGKVLDHRSDLYSLGIMMYQMASGRLPFTSNDIDKVAVMQSSAPPRRPRTINPEISKGLEQIILKAMSKKAYMRFTNAAQMSSYLEILKRNPGAVFRLSEKSVSQSSGATVYHSTNTYPALLGVIAALILTLAIALPGISDIVGGGVDGNTVSLRIPDVRGKTLQAAAEKLDESLYDIEIKYDYNSKRPSGKILEQSPSSGESVKFDPSETQCKITLTVSADPTELTMISVTSLSPDAAKAALEKEGYTVSFEEIYSDTVGLGLVCGTLPESGAKVLAGSQVTLYVSLGADIVFTEVGNYVHKSEAEVAAELITDGLMVGRVEYKASSFPDGTVLSQSVAYGQTVPEGTYIDFTVSKNNP